MATKWKNIFTVLMWISSLQTSHTYPLENNFNTYRSASFRNPNFGSRILGGGRRASNPFSDFSNGSPFTVRENEIAAVFRGVAYGSSDVPTTSTTEQTISTSTKSSPIRVTSEYIKSTTIESTLPEISPDSIERLEPLNDHLPTAYSSPSSSDPDYSSGILNYYVEENKESNRREYYPEVISSVQPNTDVISNSNKYIISDNGVTKSISVHVYMIGVLMGLIVLSSLLCLCRITSCSQLMPRGHYVTLQLLILLAASLRCITLFHDPYGLDGKFPRALMSLLVNSVVPLLSTAFALMLLVLLRASKYILISARLQSPLVLAIICGLHIGTSILADVSIGVLDYPDSSLAVEIVVRSVTIFWDAVLIIAVTVLLYQVIIRASKRRAMLPVSTSGVMLIAVTIKAVLVGFMVYHVIMRASSGEHISYERTWSWWVLISCERLLEIGFCASLLIAAATLTVKHNNFTTKEQKVFSVISGYDQNTVRIVSPTQKNFKATNFTLASTFQKKGNTMNSNFSSKTLLPSTAKVCDTTGDLSFQWNTMRLKPDICSKNIDLDAKAPGNNGPSYTRTLPPQARYYCAPVPHVDNSPVPGRIEPYAIRPQKNNIYSEIGDVISGSYDVASYYTHSELNGSNIYYSPSLTKEHQYARARSTDHLYDLPSVHNGITSGHNEEQCNKEYNTIADIDSSYNLILPLQNTQNSTRVQQPKMNNSQIDTSPDSAIVLDYSSHSEMEDPNIYHYKQRYQQYQNKKISPTSKLDFMNLSTHSLNEVFKHNSGLLSKLVGNNSNTNTGYQPLNLEEISHFTMGDEQVAHSPKLENNIIGEFCRNDDSKNPLPPVSTPLISSPITSL